MLLIMVIIIHREVAIQQRAVFGVMKQEIAIITKIARVLLGPFVIQGYLCSSIDLTHAAFLCTCFLLERDNRISCSVMYIFWMNQPHISNHNCVLAISLNHEISREASVSDGQKTNNDSLFTKERCQGIIQKILQWAKMNMGKTIATPDDNIDTRHLVEISNHKTASFASPRL